MAHGPSIEEDYAMHGCARIRKFFTFSIIEENCEKVYWNTNTLVDYHIIFDKLLDSKSD